MKLGKSLIKIRFSMNTSKSKGTTLRLNLMSFQRVPHQLYTAAPLLSMSSMFIFFTFAKYIFCSRDDKVTLQETLEPKTFLIRTMLADSLHCCLHNVAVHSMLPLNKLRDTFNGTHKCIKNFLMIKFLIENSNCC